MNHADVGSDASSARNLECIENKIEKTALALKDIAMRRRQMVDRASMVGELCGVTLFFVSHSVSISSSIETMITFISHYSFHIRVHQS